MTELDDKIEHAKQIARDAYRVGHRAGFYEGVERVTEVFEDCLRDNPRMGVAVARHLLHKIRELKP